MSQTWDENDVAQLRRLKKEGLYPGEIFNYFKGKYSIDAINSRVRRLDIIEAVRDEQPAVSASPQSWPTETMCRWPIGHPGEGGFRFCCKKSQPKKPYCAEHVVMAYRQKSETAAD